MDNQICKILFVCGVSGSGKTYLANKLVENYGDTFYKLNQYTTRPRRENEDEYYYVDNEHFDLVQSVLFAATEVNGNRYGTVPVFKEGKVAIVIVNALGLENGIMYVNRHNNLEYDVLKVETSETFKVREDERDINQEDVDLDRVLRTVPYNRKLFITNEKESPISTEEVYSTLVNSLRLEKPNYERKILCDWVTCIHNSGGRVRECMRSTVKFNSVDAFPSNAIRDEEYDIDDPEQYLSCDSYKYDRNFTRKL